MSVGDNMRAVLKTGTIAYLRKVGFKGSHPQFRRVNELGIDLVLFQFSKWPDHPAFCVEYGYTGRFDSWHGGASDQMPTVTEKNVRVWDLADEYRGRLNPLNVTAKQNFGDYWYDFGGGRYAECDAGVIAAFPIAELWFKNKRENPANKDIGFTGREALCGNAVPERDRFWWLPKS